MGWKNGGIPIAQQTLTIRAVVEIPVSVQKMVQSLGLNRPSESAERKRLELDHPL